MFYILLWKYSSNIPHKYSGWFQFNIPATYIGNIIPVIFPGNIPIMGHLYISSIVLEYSMAIFQKFQRNIQNIYYSRNIACYVGNLSQFF